MVTTNFQTFGTKGFSLRFRMYQAGETKYITVNHLLQGKLLMKHWNQKKQMFIPSAPFSEINNDILSKFKAKYDNALMDWDGSLFKFKLAISKKPLGELEHKEGKYLKDVMSWVIENAKKSKHDDGTISGTFETYQKVDRRIGEYCEDRGIRYESILMDDVDTILVNDMLEWMHKSKGGKGQYFSTMFKAALNKAHQQGWCNKDVVEKSNWVKRIRNNSRKYETLSPEQCDRFMKMNIDELPSGYKVQLYRDFCVFVLYTCQSACDALSLKYSDIKTINGVQHFVFRRRKIENKQSVECTVPINPVMKSIMDRWKKQSKDGYVFPVRSKDKIQKQKINNADIKNFVKKCNVWLKKLGKILKCSFPLRTYVFRHTAITHYISKGIPVIYVANLAGTSVENCESIYYNNQGDVVSRDKVLSAISYV